MIGMKLRRGGESENKRKNDGTKGEEKEVRIR